MTDIWLVDVDGTLAIMNDRKPYDWDLVENDLPNQPVIDVVTALIRDGRTVTLASSRKVRCLTETNRWLREVFPDDVEVFIMPEMMRPDDDNRPDFVFKKEVYDWLTGNGTTIAGVIDDRQAVVDMRREQGLTCMQVAPGNF